ncbi:TNFAIP3-interacting protein 1-like [Xyrichtys novacula]|uniref:TNFAIP3-interacting protein 1-like n=1 Tax=Xyrichtys novacula TaxID=13765 RepID=A0AAV1HAN6_XYRNO|nr:TNFAIP3-interacting protein 1-like [Xyrichtys novacula]
MSVHEKSTERLPVERSQTGKTITTVNKQISRLYPSLPHTDRFDAFVADQSVNFPLAAVSHADDQLEAPGASSGEVRRKAQILILEEQKQELLSINEKWAKEYQTMRQYYKEKVEDLKALLQHDYSHCEEEACDDEEMDKELTEKTRYKTLKDYIVTWTRDADVSSELLKAKNEAKELRMQNNTLTRRGHQQAEEIRRLNKALEEAYEKNQPHDVSSETLQELWKHQAEVYKEDFLKERSDREKLKEKQLDLEKKYRKVHSELRALKSQMTWVQTPQTALECNCRTQAKGSNWEVHQINQHHMVLQRR